MKNKTLKNLIVLGAFAFLFVFATSASAVTYLSEQGYGPEHFDNPYYNYYGNNTSNKPNYQNTYYGQQDPYASYTYVQPQVQYVQQPYTYVQPQVQYVQQPATTQIKYVTVPQTTVETVKTNTTQAASVAKANTANTVNTVKTYANSGSNSTTGQYVNYDGTNQNLLGASAYNSNVQPEQQVVYDNNGLTALSVKGSGSFMPSSVFQWFIVLLLILAIVIIARMISKTFSSGAHAAPAH